MKLIVGLGNPGEKYINTRHNIGFSVISHYLGNIKYKAKFNGLYYECLENEEKVIFLLPQTYMNNSGESVIQFVNYYNINLDDILIIHDDLDLNIGDFKFKYNSSSGGHNGIKSIINCLNSQKFLQFKIGINNKYKDDTIDFVLGNFSKEDDKLLNYDLFDKCIKDFIKYDKNYLMSTYNTRK